MRAFADLAVLRLTDGHFGKQQMLCTARAPMSGRGVLMQDEPSRRAGRQCCSSSKTFAMCCALATPPTFLQTGRIVLHDPTSDVTGDKLVREAFLGVGTP